METLTHKKFIFQNYLQIKLLQIIVLWTNHEMPQNIVFMLNREKKLKIAQKIREIKITWKIHAAKISCLKVTQNFLPMQFVFYMAKIKNTKIKCKIRWNCLLTKLSNNRVRISGISYCGFEFNIMFFLKLVCICYIT